MIRTVRALALPVLLGGAVLLGACAPQPYWVRLDRPEAVSPDGAFHVALPVGWVRAQGRKDRVALSRDGVGLQLIELWHRPAAKAFPAIDRPATPGMLPSELAGLARADYTEAVGAGGNVEVLEDAPAEVAGRPGFRLRMRVRTPEGPPYLAEMYGVADAEGFASFLYSAPERYFFARDLPVFRDVVESLTLDRP